MKGSEATGVAIRRHGAAIVAVIAASMTVIGMWGPWFASGSADRNSFGLFRAAQVLGIEWVTPFRIAWFLLPIVLAAALALAAFGARRAAMAVLALLGLVLGVAGWLSVAAFDLRLGSATTAVAGCGTVLAAVLSLAGNAMRGRAGAGVRARATIGAEAGTPSSAESRSGEPPMLSREN